MATQALYLRWRPMSFEDVVGQEHITYTLRNAISSQRIGHAYLFSGPRGTGKTTMARLLAKAANCLNEDLSLRPDNTCNHCTAVNEGRFLDLIEIDAASHTGVDDVRELRDRIAFAPNEGNYKVYIIDEVHRFSGAAFDALLKTIEEPPEHAIFVLATTEIHKVPQTILSRCQRFDFRRIPYWQTIERLRVIADSENIEVGDDVLELIARQGTGSLRDCISLFDQLMPDSGEPLTLELAQAILGTANIEVVQGLTDMILEGNAPTGLDIINHALDGGTDPRQLARQMIDYLRQVMLVQTGGPELVAVSVSQDVLGVIQQQADSFTRRALLEILTTFNEASEKSGGWQPQLPLELAFLKSVEVLFSTIEQVSAGMPAQPAAAQAPAPAPQHVQPVQQQQPEAEVQPAAAYPEESVIEQDAPVGQIDLTLADLNERWPQIIQATKVKDSSAAALLNTGKLYKIEADRVIIQMPSDILKDKLEKDEQRSVIEAVLRQFFNVNLHVHGRVQTQGSSTSAQNTDELLAEDSLAAFAAHDLGGVVSSVDDSDED